MDTMAPAARDEMMTARSCSAAQPQRSSSRTPTYLGGRGGRGRGGGGRWEQEQEGRGAAGLPPHSLVVCCVRPEDCDSCVDGLHLLQQMGREWGRMEMGVSHHPPLLPSHRQQMTAHQHRRGDLPSPPPICNQTTAHLHGCDDGGGARHGEHRVARDAQLALRLVRLDSAEEDLAGTKKEG